jgi:MscS family membrane protein
MSEALNHFFDGVTKGNPLMQLLIFAGITVLLWIVGRIVKHVLQRASKKVLNNEKPVYSALLNAISKSIIFILISIGISLLVSILTLPENIIGVAETTASILIILSFGLLGYYLMDAPGVWFEELMKKQESSLSKMFTPAIRKTLRGIVLVLVFVQIFQLLSDKPLTSVIAGLGIGGLAVALAAQDTVRHFIGSFVIAADRPFEIGDRIVVDGHDGPVEAVGMRSTRIRTLEGHLVSIPNGELANRTIQNIGKRPHIRRIGNVTITYDTPPEKIKRAVDIVKEILDNHEGMHEDFPPKVYFNELNSDSLNIMFLYWYHPPDYWKYMDFTEWVNHEIFRRFNEEGIDFAFPTQTLYLAGDEKRPLHVGWNQNPENYRPIS